MTRFVTVVFAIEDDEEFKPVMSNFSKKMASFDVENPPPVGVCAISLTNEIHRMELIEDALNRNDDFKAQELLSAVNLPERSSKALTSV